MEGLSPIEFMAKRLVTNWGKPHYSNGREGLPKNGPGELDIEVDTRLCRWPPSRAHTYAKSRAHTGFSAATFISTRWLLGRRSSHHAVSGI